MANIHSFPPQALIGCVRSQKYRSTQAFFGLFIILRTLLDQAVINTGGCLAEPRTHSVGDDCFRGIERSLSLRTRKEIDNSEADTFFT